MSRRKYHKYTDQEKCFVLEKLGDVESYADLAELFNEKFAECVTPNSIRELTNKRLKTGIGKNSGRFREHDRVRALPIGTVRTGKNGAKYVKVSDTMHIFGGYSLPDWIPIQRKAYEDVFGPIKDNEMICFLTKDRENLDINNLVCIDRGVAAIMGKNRWWFDERELTLTAIYVAKLILENGKTNRKKARHDI